MGKRGVRRGGALARRRRVHWLVAAVVFEVLVAVGAFAIRKAMDKGYERLSGTKIGEISLDDEEIEARGQRANRSEQTPERR